MVVTRSDATHAYECKYAYECKSLSLFLFSTLPDSIVKRRVLVALFEINVWSLSLLPRRQETGKGQRLSLHEASLI